jgi:hypothetical protein
VPCAPTGRSDAGDRMKGLTDTILRLAGPLVLAGGGVRPAGA